MTTCGVCPPQLHRWRPSPWGGLFGVIVGLWPQLAVADTPVNLREMCRREIAGWYLSRFDEVRQARDLLTEVRRQIGLLEDAQKGAEREFARADAASRDMPYDSARTHERYQAESRLAMLVARLDENHALEKELAVRDRITREVWERKKSRVSKLMDIDTAPDHRGEEYPRHLDFRTRCSEYRYLCPLTAEDVRAMIDLYDPDPMPEACARFAKMRGSRVDGAGGRFDESL